MVEMVVGSSPSKVTGKYIPPVSLAKVWSPFIAWRKSIRPGMPVMLVVAGSESPYFLKKMLPVPMM